MTRKKKTESIVASPELAKPRISGALAEAVRLHCDTLFVTTTAVEAPRTRYVRGKPLVVTPRGDYAKEAFERDIDAMLAELDDPNDTWDEM